MSPYWILFQIKKVTYLDAVIIILSVASQESSSEREMDYLYV